MTTTDTLREALYNTGERLLTIEHSISFYRLRESVYCVRSHTQIDYTCAAADWEATARRNGWIK